MEAIYLFTGAKSFGGEDREMVGLGEVKTLLQLEFFGEGRTQTAQISLAPKRRFTSMRFCWTAAPNWPASLPLWFPSPCPHPGRPPGEAAVLDTIICQLKPKYIRVLNDYSRVLAQRNSLPKTWLSAPCWIPWTSGTSTWYGCRPPSPGRGTPIWRSSNSWPGRCIRVFPGKEEFSLRYLSKACPDLDDLSPGLEEATEAVRARRGGPEGGQHQVGPTGTT